MRYLLQDEFKNELKARTSYLYDVLKLWFIVENTEDGFLQLTSFPSKYFSEILMILGHNCAVKNHLINNKFPESVVVAITCDGICNYENINLPNKKLYIPFQNKSNLADLLYGEMYGFDFDITESELKFYNSPKSLAIEMRIDKSFQNINKHGRNNK